jgi:hypothetical protein
VGQCRDARAARLAPRSLRPRLGRAPAPVSGGLCAGRAPARGECRQAGVQRHARASLAAGRQLLVPAGVTGRILLRQGRSGEQAGSRRLRSRRPRAIPGVPGPPLHGDDPALRADRGSDEGDGRQLRARRAAMAVLRGGLQASRSCRAIRGRGAALAGRPMGSPAP